VDVVHRRLLLLSAQIRPDRGGDTLHLNGESDPNGCYCDALNDTDSILALYLFLKQSFEHVDSTLHRNTSRNSVFWPATDWRRSTASSRFWSLACAGSYKKACVDTNKHDVFDGFPCFIAVVAC
jgi:hypothetical protein